jgi:UTP:GlnB (protein PII) uridylyltransferase
VDNSTLPSASSSSSRSVADAAEEEEEELMITTNLVAPDEVVRSLLGGEEARRELDTRVGRVVRETGVVGLAVEEVIRTLSRAVTGMVDQPE